ncbi:redoxin family protein [Peptoniphilus sp. GNH]|nr:redoxin family protein [Clostridiales bacterium KA00134]UHR02638.1 redoxin family protein [Peptoniphilus sp. GNH]
MKNMTGKKRFIAGALALIMAASLAGCGKNKTTNKEQANPPKQEESQKDEAKNVEEVKKKVQELLNEENQIMERDKELWDKLFAKVDKKADLENKDDSYAGFLFKIIDKYKDNFTEEELKTLKKSAEEIQKLDEEVALYEKDLKENIESKSEEAMADKFPAFKGQDLDGNPVDESIFKKNAVTVVNFWFNGCAPCVKELPELEKLNQELKAKGAGVIGINTETLDDNKGKIEEAKQIMKKQGVQYPNITFESSSDAGAFALKIMAFPTTILVDRNGNIIGQPLLGGIDQKENYDKLMKAVDEVIAADQK